MEDLKENYSSHSIDAIQRRPNKKLEIIIEENNSFNQDINNQEMPESKTQANFYSQNNLFDVSKRKRIYNSSEKRKRSEILHEKVKQILEYKNKFKTFLFRSKHKTRGQSLHLYPPFSPIFIKHILQLSFILSSKFKGCSWAGSGSGI